jgi:hypothetical protein|tara:strand:+ start:3503 stop:4015 length:513 start_codon:yes stop_codon:yes gene_type:complete
MTYEVIDDAISEDSFHTMRDLVVCNKEFPWYMCDEITHKGVIKDGFYFYHMFYDSGLPINLANCNISWACQSLQGLMNRLDPKAIIRIKGNFYPTASKHIEHPLHADMPFPHKSAIYSLNTCDGYTLLEDGTKIDSVANRLFLFDASNLHSSSTCTDHKAGRFNINVNYF